jgi:tetratricopeptide (TPR) repeat protein
LWQQLSGEYPTLPHYRAALATSLRVLGLQTAIAGESSRSDKAMRQARQVAEQLATDFPGVPGFEELLHGIVPEGIGYVQEHAGRLEEAEKSYREMLACYESLVNRHSRVERYQVGLFWARQWLGRLLWAMDRRAEAVEQFRQECLLGEQLSRNDPDIQDGLAWLLATCPDTRFRDVPRAIQLAQTAIKRAPGHGGYWATLGAAHYAAGDYSAAVKALEKAVQLPNYWGSCPRFYLAMAKAQLGQKDDAQGWYEKAVARLEQHEERFVESLRVRDEAAKVLGITAK